MTSPLKVERNKPAKPRERQISSERHVQPPFDEMPSREQLSRKEEAVERNACRERQACSRDTQEGYWDRGQACIEFGLTIRAIAENLTLSLGHWPLSSFSVGAWHMVGNIQKARQRGTYGLQMKAVHTLSSYLDTQADRISCWGK